MGQCGSVGIESPNGVWCVELKDAVDAGKSLNNRLPKDIAHIRITNNAGLTEIRCPGFLYGCRTLTSIDLAPLSKVTTIGDDFLSDCSSLKSIDLAPLSNVTTIRGNFLYDCRSLTSIDLAPLSNVTTIGHSFLDGCSSLKSIDLAPLPNVINTDWCFLKGCSSLTSIDLAPLSKDTTIGNFFLGGCSSLTSVDLRPLSNVTTIGVMFLSYCRSLTSIDLAPLSKVTTIGEGFLDGCSSLNNISVASLECAVYRCLDKCHKNVTRLTTSVVDAEKAGAAKAAAEKATAEEKAAAEKAAVEKAAAEKAAAEKAAAEKAAAEKAAAERAAAEKAAAVKAAAERAAAEKATADKAAAEKAAAEKAAAEKAAAEKAAAERAAAEKAAAVKAAAEKAAAEKAAAEKAAAEKAAAEKAAGEKNVDDNVTVVKGINAAIGRLMSSESAPPSIMPFDPLESDPHFQAISPCRNIVKEILLSGPSTISLQVKERAVGKVLTIAAQHASCVSEDVGTGCGQSFDEVFAIVAYTADVRGVGLPNEDNLFVRLNAVLRSRDPEKCKPFLEYYFYLVNGLRKMPKCTVKTWRGIDKPVTALSKLYGVGRLLSWPQFTSTSTDQNVMKQFAGKANGSLLQFSLTSAVSIRDWSLIPDEDEYLILPNTVLKVTTVVSAEQAKDLEGFDGMSVGGGHYDVIVIRE